MRWITCDEAPIGDKETRTAGRIRDKSDMTWRYYSAVFVPDGTGWRVAALRPSELPEGVECQWLDQQEESKCS